MAASRGNKNSAFYIKMQRPQSFILNVDVERADDAEAMLLCVSLELGEIRCKIKQELIVQARCDAKNVIVTA